MDQILAIFEKHKQTTRNDMTQSVRRDFQEKTTD